MNTEPELLIFTKVPELAACKTRLSSILSENERNKLMSAFLVDTLELASKSSFQHRTLATAPETSPAALSKILERNTSLDSSSLVSRFSLVAQQGESFSERLNNCLSAERSIAILGSDAPLLNQECLSDAFKALQNSNSCFGPTPDGGLWLIGISAQAVKSGFNFERVFSDHNLLDIESITKEFSRIDAPFQVLRQMSDVDLPEDLAVLKTHLYSRKLSETKEDLPTATLGLVRNLDLQVSKSEKNNRRFRLK